MYLENYVTLGNASARKRVLFGWEYFGRWTIRGILGPGQLPRNSKRLGDTASFIQMLRDAPGIDGQFYNPRWGS